MEITEVNIKLLAEPEGQLMAYCSITFDNEFAIKDIRIIEGRDGLFIAMPSRKASDKCPKCGGKNHLKAKFCNDCGHRLNPARGGGEGAKNTLFMDVAHPINPMCRDRIQKAILEAYEKERKAQTPDGRVP